MRTYDFYAAANMLRTTREYARAAGGFMGYVASPLIPDKQLPVGALKEKNFSQIQASAKAHPGNEYLKMAARPEIFAILSQFDGGGTPDASLPSNWGPVDFFFTAGAAAMMTQPYKLSKMDVERWAMLDGKPGLSPKDNEILERMARKFGTIDA